MKCFIAVKLTYEFANFRTLLEILLVQNLSGTSNPDESTSFSLIRLFWSLVEVEYCSHTKDCTTKQHT